MLQYISILKFSYNFRKCYATTKINQETEMITGSNSYTLRIVLRRRRDAQLDIVECFAVKSYKISGKRKEK